MHECNAMQLLETKKKKKIQKPKNKKQWSQRKSNEAQGPRKVKTDQGHKITPIT